MFIDTGSAFLSINAGDMSLFVSASSASLFVSTSNLPSYGIGDALSVDVGDSLSIIASNLLFVIIAGLLTSSTSLSIYFLSSFLVDTLSFAPCSVSTNPLLLFLITGTMLFMFIFALRPKIKAKLKEWLQTISLRFVTLFNHFVTPKINKKRLFD